MFQPTDHVVRSIFRSYGLWGPLTSAELFTGYRMSEIELFTDQHTSYQSTVVHRGVPLVLENRGTAIDALDLDPFTSLDEVMELVELMCSSADIRTRVMTFLQWQKAYKGQLLAPTQGVSARYDEDLQEPYRLETSVTRRNHLKVTEVTLGPTFNWEDFARSFSELSTS